MFLSIACETIFASCKFRAELFNPLYMCDLGSIVPKKNVFLLITWERVFFFFFFIKIRNKIVLYCYRGNNCSEFQITSGTNWSLMDYLRTIVPKNVFFLTTWERVFFL